MIEGAFEMTTTCPHCGRVNELGTKVSGDGSERPTPGAFSMCFTCGVFSAYDEDLSLRKLNKEEAMGLLQDQGIINMMIGWRELTDPNNQKGTQQ